MAGGNRRALWLLVAGLAAAPALHAAPGSTLFYDNLNGNLNKWTVNASGGDANIDNKAAAQGRSLELRWGPVSVYTDPIAAAVPGAELSLWIRRGDNSFSNYPETGEDLVIEYRDAGNGWHEIARYDGGGTAGEIYMPALTLPAGALHANLSIRLSLTSGNGNDYDYWHIDDVRVTETAASGSPPFSPGSCEDFESGLSGWVISSSGGSAGTSTATANSPTHSLYTQGGVVSVTSLGLDLSSSSGLDLSLWVRRGADSFSENPESGENLVLEYLTSGGSWAALETFFGGDTPGEILARSYSLPADAYHSGFSVRLRQIAGSGANYDYWHVDDVCLSANQPILFSFEEDGWTGAPDEVSDSGSAGLTGTAAGGADNASSTPALAGNPGTCRYGDFDGVDDYIEIPDDPALDIPDELTVGAWIYLRSYPPELYTIASKDWNYEYHINSSGQVYWWWNDSSGTTRSITTAASIGLNQWHHVAIVYASGSQTIYIDGIVQASASYTGTLRQNDLPFYIATDYDFISRAFDGYIDEVTVDAKAYTQTEVQTLHDATHPCAVASAEFTINHDGYGIHCAPETITVNVVDAVAGTPLTSYNASVVLDTQTGNGSWSLVSGGGTLTDATADDGQAVYDWPLGESVAQFALTYTQGVPTFDIDAYQLSDPGIRDTDAEGPITFSASGFTLTAAPLANPPPGTINPFASAETAAVPFGVYIAAYGQTANDPVCGIIESYTGTKNLKFWSSYLDPATGSRSVAVDGNPVASAEGAALAQNVVFTSGQAAVSVKYKDVGRLALAVKDDTPADPDLPAGLRGATAGFVSRPARFVLTGIADAAGGVSNPAAADASGARFISAGAPFQVTVTALDAEGDATPNFGRESIAEGVRLEPLLQAPAGGANPPVSAATGFAGFANGSATGADFTWPEVGIIELRPHVDDGDYLGTGDVSGDDSGNVGRFVPSYFALTLNAPSFATQCGTGGFTYAGQPFGFAVAPTITARAYAAAGTPTQNYTGDFFKLATTTLANRSYTSSSGTLDLAGLPPATADPSVTETAPGVATLLFGSGSGLVFARDIVDPFAASISLSIDVLDADGVAALANPAEFGNPGGIAFSGGDEIRYGRLRLVNALGSELVNLPVPLEAEYFAGSAQGFVPNTDDSCTSGVSLSLGSFTENLDPGETCVLDSGSPGASGAGCTVPAGVGQQFRATASAGDFNLILKAPGQSNQGGVRIDSTVPSWLRFDWDAATPGDENPWAQATFGLYGGDAAQIYLSEIY